MDAVVPDVRIEPAPRLRLEIPGPPQHPAIRITQDQPEMASLVILDEDIPVCR